MTTTVAVEKQTAPAAVDAPGAPATEVPATEVMEQELLVEDVSIDGMCGVY